MSVAAIDCLDVRQSLPWLVNGTLSGAERTRVEEHLASCALCREEAERCRAERAFLREEELTPPSPHPAQLERLLERVERHERGEAAEDAADPDAPVRLESLLRRTPRVVRLALAAQLVAIAGLGIFLAGGPAARPPAGTAAAAAAPYRTLSDPTTEARGTLRVVFAPAATEAEIRALLLSASAEIVAGPSPRGAYTLRLVAAADLPPLDAVLALLRADPRVRLAEPVAGAVAGGPPDAGSDAPPR